MLDVKTSVLRFWEGEFEQLRPIRTSSGQRLYNEDHIVLLRRIKELLYDEGLTIEGAKKKLEAGWNSDDLKLSDEIDDNAGALPLFSYEKNGDYQESCRKLLLHVRDELLSIKEMLD